MVSKTYDLRDLLMGTRIEAPQMDVSQALSQVGSGGSGGGSGSTIFGGSGRVVLRVLQE